MAGMEEMVRIGFPFPFPFAFLFASRPDPGIPVGVRDPSGTAWGLSRTAAREPGIHPGTPWSGHETGNLSAIPGTVRDAAHERAHGSGISSSMRLMAASGGAHGRAGWRSTGGSAAP
jgi:hypothetical protein